MTNVYTLIVSRNGSDVYFKINNTTPIKRVWGAYCQRNGIYVLFKHNGILIPKEDYEKPVRDFGIEYITTVDAKLG